MSPKKKSEKVIVTEEMNLLVDEIKALVKVRDALSYGTKSGSDPAESVMIRRINNRVIQLSEHILDTFGKEEKNK